MTCTACGTENRPGRRFCSECGSPLEVACPACGAGNDPADKFCGSCGTALTEAAERRASPTTEAPAGPPAASERKLVTVLFADLVGFTAASESRDPEEVRELLSSYFDESRRIITRYGGTVEKFIGDAVMAVWGTPTAQEDDAERGVRAALELAAAVDGLGAEVGAPSLQARVGVLTGDAAVTIGAEGQGMVAGDLVNTASRIQSAAEPGAVLVGETTRRASEAAILYEDAGSHTLKGKAEPVPLWRAVRVVGGRGGVMRAASLEAPFVGRSRELRIIKEMFHASGEERKAHLVSVLGVAGVGKNRLSWEFEKYVDGLVETVRWHRGRSLAYGEGVAYWALAEMIRGRCGIVEGEPQASAAEKLHATVEEFVPNPDEREWIEPRLAHLLGLEERTAPDQADLFSAWRLFFERLSDTGPVDLIFEDLHWADRGLLDFIEHLLDWSRDFPIFILTLARPELADRRPEWGGGRRNVTSVFLDPLASEEMDELISGLVPGLPDELRVRVRDRAEGIPLYAIETVRMLLDRGILERVGDEYRPTGEIDQLDVPETLHALIAARLDGLAPEERRLLQDGSVLGKTFTRRGLAQLTDMDEPALEQLLSSLVRKDLLSVQADPRSPERGQYGFLQDLVRKIAYDTLSKRDRKARHLKVADYLESGVEYEEDEVVEVVASHLVEAYEAAPDADDASDIRRRAAEALSHAGERSSSLAAHAEAERYFEEAGRFEERAARRAELVTRAGQSAWANGEIDRALVWLQEAVGLLEKEGATRAAARVAALLGEVLWHRGRSKEALQEIERAYEVLSGDEPDEALAHVAAQLGRFLYFSGETEAGYQRLEAALDVAESLWVPEVVSAALNTKAVVLYGPLGRWREANALMKYSLEVALEHDLPGAALRAYYNLSDLATLTDRAEEARAYADAGLALARRVGDRYWEWSMLGQVYPLYSLGEWDTVVTNLTGLPTEKAAENRASFIHYLNVLPRIYVFRGQLDKAKQTFGVFQEARDSGDLQDASAYRVGEATILRAEGRPADALEQALRAVAVRLELGLGSENAREGLLEGIEAAFELDDVERVGELLRIIEDEPRGKRPPGLEAQAVRFRARLVARDGGDPSDGYKLAVGMFRELQVPFWRAMTLLELAEWLAGRGRGEEATPLATEASEVFERLRAAPWLERASAVSGVEATAPAG